MKKFLSFITCYLFFAVAIVAAVHYYPVPDVMATAHFHRGHSYLPHLALMVSAIDSTRARAAYERIAYVVSCLADKLKPSSGSGALGGAREIIINNDDLLTEQVIMNNESSYTFDVWDKTLQTSNPKRPLVKGVKDNDLFMAIGARLLIDSRTIGQSNVKVQTWPSPDAFSGSGATPDDLWSIYNSRWSLQVDRVVYVPKSLTRKFLIVPEYSFNSSAGDSFTPINILDGRVFYELDPYPILSGRLDNELTLDVPLYNGWNGAANNEEYATVENVISFEFTGYTIKNGAQYIGFFNGKLSVDNPDDLASC